MKQLLPQLFFCILILAIAGTNANAQVRTFQKPKPADTTKLRIKESAPPNSIAAPQPTKPTVQPVTNTFLLNTPTTMVQAAPAVTTPAVQPQTTTPAYVAPPELVRAFQWWRAINPEDFSIYQSPFNIVTHTRYDTTIEKFAGKQSLTFKGWMHQQGWPLWRNDSLVHLRQLANLVQLDLPLSFVNDSAFQILGTITQLKAVYFHSGTNVPYRNGSETIYPNHPVTDVGLAGLLQNTTLEYVGFQNLGQITDAGFAHFGNLRNLKVLQTLGWTSITDNALLSLQNCGSLETLYLVRSNITDQGLNLLLQIKDKLPKLKMLYLNDSKVTTAGIASFQQNWGKPINVQFNYN